MGLDHDWWQLYATTSCRTGLNTTRSRVTSAWLFPSFRKGAHVRIVKWVGFPAVSVLILFVCETYEIAEGSLKSTVYLIQVYFIPYNFHTLLHGIFASLTCLVYSSLCLSFILEKSSIHPFSLVQDYIVTYNVTLKHDNFYDKTRTYVFYYYEGIHNLKL